MAALRACSTVMPTAAARAVTARAACSRAALSARALPAASFLSGSRLACVQNKARIAASVQAPASHESSALPVATSYKANPKGKKETLEFRIFIEEKDGKTVSPWHDIPLKVGDGLYNFVCEIPKESKAKMEVATEEATTPIKQDVKKGKLRFYPYNINWNYGLLPQTWEDPSHASNDLPDAFGDNDPVDVVEIGSRTAKMGEVYPVKVVAILAMIDEGELDWKVVAIAADDPKAKELNDIADVEKHFPGELEKIRVWFRDYKVPDGKPQNKFGFDDKPQSAAYAKKVIDETNGYWAALVKREIPAGDLSLA